MYPEQKIRRNERYEAFKEIHLPYISLHCDCSIEGKKNDYKLMIDDEALVYYPKSNKVHYPLLNKWLDNGLNHIYKRLKIQKL